jgi:uncharacterized tellurite resistance protein B-like protein
MNTNRCDRNYLLVAGLAHVAWTDDRLHAGEASFFRELIGGLTLDKDETIRIWQLTLCPVPLAELDWSGLTTEDRHQFLRFAHAMAEADGGVSDGEFNRMQQLASALQVPWADALEIIGHKLAW